MASEKIDVTVTTSSDTNDDGFGDAELQGTRPPPVETVPKDMLEVCTSSKLPENVTRLSHGPEVHQPVVRSLLQHHSTLLVGRLGLDLPIRPTQWWPFRHGLGMHFCMLWRYGSGLLHGRNGLHVRKPIPVVP
jgi:hypothetical protein